ncbi:MAG: hypothetical protein LQ347_001263 [Umbilicaria vellea]|nr:MAG: hypothetical protein LQ347_001263 [Umbilicaria vellea]
MGKFGFGKKGEGDEDSNRSALFGGRSKNKPTNPSSNPYAQPVTAPDPYTQAKLNIGVGDPPRGPSPANSGYSAPSASRGGYGGMSGGGYAADKKPGGVNGGDNDHDTDSQNRSGYGADRYGARGGYGVDRYGGGAGASTSDTAPSRYGPGGYGGLGRTNSVGTTTTDDNRNALFGGARERLQQQQVGVGIGGGAGGDGHPPPYGAVHGQSRPSGAYGNGESQGYGAYEDRQLTAEEEEEEDVLATKQQIRFVKQEDVSSTRNALRIAAQAEETGRNTLARLGAQGERIHNTEKNLDLAANHNRIAEDKARELKTLNKSMFAVHVSNPFTASSRRQQRDDDIINKHRSEREQRESSRQAAFESNQRLDRTFRELQPGDAGYAATKGKSTLAERAKYQFEADSEDDEMENEIDSNLDALSGAATRLNGLARATGKEVDEQNRHLERITGKASNVFRLLGLLRSYTDNGSRVTLLTIKSQ